MELTPTNEAGSVIGRLARHRAAAGRLFIALGVIIGLGAAYVLSKAGPFGGDAVGADPVGFATGLWLAAVAVASISAGWIGVSGGASAHVAARRSILTLASGAGAATFFFGLALLYFWSEATVRLVRDGERDGAWKVLLGLVALVGGLGIMFLGLQAIRGDERRDLAIRRTVYGFNAFLTGFLLFAVLLVANVISYLKLPASIDMTQAGIYSITDRSRQILEQIDRPTRIYLIMDGRDQVYQDMQSLLSMSQEVAPKITVESLSSMQPNRIRELARTFPQLTENTQGVLIVYGDEKIENSAFIRDRDLFSEDFEPGGREPKRKFLGEVKLMNELSFLMAGKDRPIVYFTQGSGEADITDRTKPQAFGNVVDKLQRRNFEVRPLTLDALGAAVPDDAKIVVVAGPRQTLPPAAVDAIKAFLDRGGRLVALFDVEANRTDKEIPLTGLEGVLASFGVEVTREKIFSVPGDAADVRSLDEAIVMIDPASEASPLGAPFKNVAFQFFGARVLRAAPPAADSPFRAAALLSTLDKARVWTETDPQSTGLQTLQTMIRDPKARERLSATPLVMAMAVTETPRTGPGQPRPAERPRIVVFGDATFLANALAGGRTESSAYLFDLFAGSLDWLRERPSNIGIEPRVTPTFELNPAVIGQESAIKFLPLLIATIGVLGLGLGVWLVRRQ
jgi:uncharacterized membrane protein YhaH (DUF805 family)